jgi:hypothetical protein
LKTEILNKINSAVSKSDFSNKTDYTSFSKYIKSLLDFSVYLDGTKYNVEYSMGRKDFSLLRLFEDEFITEDELTKAFVQ